MNRSFSLATLNLIVAVAAVSLASIRTALARMWRGDSVEIAWLVIAGALAGLIFGAMVAIWNRPGWLTSLATVTGGFFMGAAAGAQLSIKVEWPVLIAGPYVLISAVLLVAANRRRRVRAQPEIFEQVR